MTITSHSHIKKVQIAGLDHYTYPLGIMKREIVLGILLIFLSGACSTLNPDNYISVRADQNFDFRRSQPIYVALPEPQTIKEEGFRKILVTEMRHVGLAVSDQMTQDTLVLFFQVNDESQNIIRIPGNPALSRLPAQWQEIHLELFDLQNVNQSEPVWKGYLKVRIKSFNAQPGNTLRPLLELVGKSYEGPAPVTVYTKTEPGPRKDEIERLEEKVKTLEERIEELQTPTPSEPSDQPPSNSQESL